MNRDPEDPRVARSRAAALAAARELFAREGLDAVTHLRVAEASGLGRKTLYRHFPQPVDLLRATLSTAELPRAPLTGDLARDLRAHLESLRRALVDGPLARVVAALAERAPASAELRAARAELVREGTASLDALFEASVARGDLPSDLDRRAARAALEGPLFYAVLVLGERPRPSAIAPIVRAFLAAYGKRR